MRSAGLPWTAVDRPDRRPSPNRRRYGVMERDIARNHGYHPPRDPEIEETNRKVENRERRLGPKAKETAFGPGGCWEAAWNELSGGVVQAAAPEVVESLARGSFTESRKDPEVRAAVRKWSSCMASRGLSFEDPLAASGDPRWDSPSVSAELHTGTSLLSAEEKKAALADVACKEESRLVPVWSSAEAEIQTRLISENRTRLDPWKRLRETRLRNAVRVLGLPGPVSSGG
jgi:hypothetical protein